MQPGCPPCSECSAGLTGLRGDVVLTTSRVGYLETRRAAPGADAGVGAGGALRRCCSCCLPLRLTAAVTPASADDAHDDTPATTVTTVTPCTPPPGALPPPIAAIAALPEPEVPEAPEQPGDADGDRAFLDLSARESRCGAARCVSGCLPRSPCRERCVPSSDKLSGLRELEGRCCAVLAILTFMGMVVGLAIFSDPLLLDLSTRLQRARCTTINYSIPMGATNCTWASCRESCTTQAFKCPQIFVNYTLVPESELDAGDNEDTADNTTDSAGSAGTPGQQGSVPLQVNVAGCGLDAVKYSCTKFHGEYMAVGHEFDCDVAVQGPWQVAVPAAVRAQGAGAVPAWLGGFLPLVLCVACILYIRARRLFSVDPVAAAGPKIKRFSLLPRGAERPRTFYMRKIAEIDEWRQRRRQLVLTGPGRGSAASRVHADDSDELMPSDEQDEDDDLEDVVVGTVCIEPRPRGLDEDDDDDDVAVEMELPPTPPESPEPPPPPHSNKLPPPPPPCSPETSPPPTPDLVPLIVLPASSSGSSRPLGAIAEEPQVAISPRSLERGGSSRSQRSGSSATSDSWRGEPVQKTQQPLQTVSGAVQADQSYDITH